jgi:hypothetical protein
MNAGEVVFFLYIAVCVLLLLPLAFFRRTRAFAVASILAGTWAAGAVLWITSVGILYFDWGWRPLIFGLFFMGVGVVPVAWVLCLWDWLPQELGDLAFLTVGTFLPRIALAIWVIRAGERGNNVDEST